MKIQKNNVVAQIDADKFDALTEGEFRIVRVLAKDETGEARQYDMPCTVVDGAGLIGMSTWVYNTQNTRKPRPGDLVTPKGSETPKTLVAGVVNITQALVNHRRPDGFNLTTKLSMELAKGESVGLKKALDKCLDEFDQTVEATEFAAGVIEDYFPGIIQLKGAARAVYNEAFHGVEDAPSFSKAWDTVAKWHEAAGSEMELCSMGEFLGRFELEHGFAENKFVELVAEQQENYLASQSNKAVKQVAEQVDEERDSAMLVEQVDPTEASPMSTPTVTQVPKELAGAYDSVDTVNTMIATLWDEVPMHKRDSVDVGMMRSALAEALDRAEPGRKTLARWNAKLQKI